MGFKRQDENTTVPAADGDAVKQSLNDVSKTVVEGMYAYGCDSVFVFTKKISETDVEKKISMISSKTTLEINKVNTSYKSDI